MTKSGKNVVKLAMSFIGVLPVCNEKTRAVIEYLLVAFALGYSVYLYLNFKWNFIQWDFLLLTGVGCFYIGLKEVGLLRGRFENTLKRLIERGVILLRDHESYDILKNELETKAKTWMQVTGFICALAMFIAFVVAQESNHTTERLLLTIAETAGAYIAGNYLGRMIWYGRFGNWLPGSNKNYHIDPSHVDGLSGTKPLGEYYFYQASIASIPAVFLAVWWILIPFWPKDYLSWHNPYFGLLIIAICIEILAFIIPLISFHRLMMESKNKLISEADTLSASMANLKAKLVEDQDVNQAKTLKDQLSEITDRYWSIENMKTWPVDIKTGKKFSINNFFLLLPVIYNSFQEDFKFDEFFNGLSKLQIF